MTSRWLATDESSSTPVQIIGGYGVSVSGSHPSFIISSEDTAQTLTGGDGISIDDNGVINITTDDYGDHRVGGYAKQIDLDLSLEMYTKNEELAVYAKQADLD